MGVLGVTVIVASIIYLCVWPQPWLRHFRGLWNQQARIEPPPASGDGTREGKISDRNGSSASTTRSEKEGVSRGAVEDENGATRTKTDQDRHAMPPPPIIRKPQPPPPTLHVDEDQKTPTAGPSVRTDSVPTFSLSADQDTEPELPEAATGPAMFPAPFSAQRASSGAPGLMAPPPTRLPALTPVSSFAPSRSLPIPNRGPPAASSSSLAPPPTASTKPAKPSRKVMLTPGHSPMDWARISGPNADLRNLPPDTPYLRVTPSMLKHYNGRKGKDAWTAMGGRVYNMTPYLPYHPGGVPELMRCAGRNGDKLFGEVHPWVNYETMLAACLVGIAVDEDDVKEQQAPSKMEEMD